MAHGPLCLLLNFAIFGAFILLKCITDGTLCPQLLLQFHTDQFETVQALLSWSVDVHVVLALLSIYYLAFSICLSIKLCIWSGMIRARILKFCISMNNKKTHIVLFFCRGFSLGSYSPFYMPILKMYYVMALSGNLSFCPA